MAVGCKRRDDCGPGPSLGLQQRSWHHVLISESGSPARAPRLCVLSLFKQSDIGWYLWRSTLMTQVDSPADYQKQVDI